MSSYDGSGTARLPVSKATGMTASSVWITGNVQLWPRTLAVVANAEQSASLNDAQRGWLTKAIDNTIPSTATFQRNTEELAVLCRRGKAHMIMASSAELQQLPRQLRACLSVASHRSIDGATARADRRITGEHDGRSQRCSCLRSAESVGDKAEAVSPVDGNYLVDITASDLRAAGDSPEEAGAENYGEFGSFFDRGHFAFTQHQSPACTWGYGTFTVTGDKLEIVLIDGGGIAPNNGDQPSR